MTEYIPAVINFNDKEFTNRTERTITTHQPHLTGQHSTGKGSTYVFHVERNNSVITNLKELRWNINGYMKYELINGNASTNKLSFNNMFILGLFNDIQLLINDMSVQKLITPNIISNHILSLNGDFNIINNDVNNIYGHFNEQSDMFTYGKQNNNHLISANTLIGSTIMIPISYELRAIDIFTNIPSYPLFNCDIKVIFNRSNTDFMSIRNTNTQGDITLKNFNKFNMINVEYQLTDHMKQYFNSVYNDNVMQTIPYHDFHMVNMTSTNPSATNIFEIVVNTDRPRYISIWFPNSVNNDRLHERTTYIKNNYSVLPSTIAPLHTVSRGVNSNSPFAHRYINIAQLIVKHNDNIIYHHDNTMNELNFDNDISNYDICRELAWKDNIYMDETQQYIQYMKIKQTMNSTQQLSFKDFINKYFQIIIDTHTLDIKCGDILRIDMMNTNFDIYRNPYQSTDIDGVINMCVMIAGQKYLSINSDQTCDVLTRAQINE